MAVNSFNAQNPPVTTKGDVFTFSTIPTRLGVGTNNQVLMADSTQSTGLKYANEATATLTAKGDILTATAANAISRLAVGSNNQVLTADSTTATGLKWAAVSPNLNWANVASANFSSVSSITLSSITATQRVVVALMITSGGSSKISVRFNSDTGSNYYAYMGTGDNSDNAGQSDFTATTTSGQAAKNSGVYMPVLMIIDGLGGSGPKVLTSFSGVSTAASTGFTMWAGSAAITSMTFTFDGNRSGTYRVVGI